MPPMTSPNLAATILEDIRADVQSGATQIARKAGQCITAFSEESTSSAKTYWNDLVRLGKDLIAAQPSMASVFNLINQVLLTAEPLQDAPSPEAVQRATREAALQFMKTADASLEAIAQHAQGLITSSSSIFTHSSSSTVVGILRQAIRQGKAIEAIATESRPHCEGRELGRSLGQQGIHTRLILDAAIGQYVKEADLVLLGVDRISEETFVNKVGTLLVVMAAKNDNIPVYLACETSKFLPTAFAPAGNVMRSSEESAQEEWQNVELVYSYFEEIPNSWLTGIISEDGILSMNALSKRFKAFRICSPLLK
jgi:translation initiation factor 2B subunit (eIF-2B alpha/beta/delta family)